MDLTRPRSTELFERAEKLIPGGVNSPVRAFRAVGMKPLFISSAKGAYITDVDGRTYIDYVCSWGPMILGHAHPEVISALQRAAERGTSYGAPTELELLLAEEICRAVPSIEMLRLCSSGTEATMSAIRLARGYTGRNLVVKFVGCYHGHGDSLLVRAGSGVATFGLPDSPGVPADFAKHTLAVDYNDEEALGMLFEQLGEQIACVIVEPVAGNMGCVLPKAGFLEALRELTSRYGALLIFDEVMTGFRLSRAGAQGIYPVKPDITCLGKIIGGGLPMGAFGGRRQIMQMLAPSGPVYQAGTLSGNPLAVTAGLTTLRLLDDSVYTKLESATRKLCEGIVSIAAALGVPVKVNQAGSMFTVFFTDKPVTDWPSAKASNTELFARFFRTMLKEGIYLPPSQFEAAFLSVCHADEEIEKTLTAVRKAFGEIR
ncbi:MAG: glutamate-1-semialdehyde 2,1-aminomutase [Acidobacteriota bacterium]|nr:glutamate-1-semialdehyde 2,1-aminomutase [Blastocatellia bacterium]MDW8411637.1 glutamate-1-semialdehyde 2,1-aminomutase [Acidobacteriota bacterium]